MISHDERNRFILRRTLSAVAWICAFWTAALFAPLTAFGPPDLRSLAVWMLAHGALLGAAGVGLWKPRRWGWAATFAAAAASLGFVILDLRRGNVQAAVVDGLFPLYAAVIFVRTRPPRLDPASGQGYDRGGP